MPRKSFDYSKIYFYKIVCKDLNIKECYVGHTTNFKNRKSEHKRSCLNETNKSHNLNMYKFICENGNWQNWDMVLIETVSCQDGLEVRKKEREDIENEQTILNKAKPYVSQQDISDYKKQWSIDNYEKVKASKEIYYKNNKEIVK